MLPISTLTQLVWATSDNVGCGISLCPILDNKESSGKYSLNFVCNYGPAYVLYIAIFLANCHVVGCCDVQGFVDKIYIAAGNYLTFSSISVPCHTWKLLFAMNILKDVAID